MSDVSPLAELAIHMAIELALMNDTIPIVSRFVNYVLEHYKDFSTDYNNSSHMQRHSTGSLERVLVNHLIQLASFHCSQHNCMIASQIMVFLGYESYQLRSNRFRQKVENYLRKERKSGGGVPPSTRSGKKKIDSSGSSSKSRDTEDTKTSGTQSSGSTGDIEDAQSSKIPLYPSFKSTA